MVRGMEATRRAAVLEGLKDPNKRPQLCLPGPKQRHSHGLVRAEVSVRGNLGVDQVDPALRFSKRPWIASPAVLGLLRFALQPLKIGLPIRQDRARRAHRGWFKQPLIETVKTHAASPMTARARFGSPGRTCPNVCW